MTIRGIPTRLLQALTAATLVLTCLTGCGEPDPGPAAAALAAGLASGDLSGTPLRDPATATTDLAATVAGMDGAQHRVQVTNVGEPTRVDGQTTATVELRHTWSLGFGPGRDGTWTYPTTTTLTLDGEAWHLPWRRALLGPLEPGERFDLQRSQAQRAAVLGDGAVTLVENRPVMRVGIDRGRVDPTAADASARALADLVGVDADAFAARVTKAGPKAFVEALVLRADAVPREVTDGYPTIPGAAMLRDELPLAPTREFARPILGSVGPVTAELIDKNPGRYVEGDLVGLSGLQSRYDDVLGGAPGVAVLATAADGTQRTVFEKPAEPGHPVTSTLNPQVQSAAEAALAGIGPASAVVVIRASTGQVLAAASGPGSQGYSTATLARPAPGSTFKVVTTLALLRSGMTPDSPLPCPATITVDGRTFTNYADFPADRIGTLTLRQALALSCNTAFLSAADTVGPEALAAAAASLGIGWDAAATGMPVHTGSVPADVSTTEAAAALIGQGKVTASPLAMATVAASVAAGRTVTPRLVTDPAPAQPAASTLTPAEAQTLRELMRGVVTDGTAGVLADLPGDPIAKTGTAEFGGSVPPATHAWMIAARGDLAVAVFVDEGASGSRVAGPIMHDLLAVLPG